jgi:hypothetical protein
LLFAFFFEKIKIFDEVRKTFQLAEGDFPRLDEYKSSLQLSDIAAFPRIDRKTLNSLQEMLIQDIPRIISIVAGVVNSGPGGASADGDNSNADSEGMVYNARRINICNSQELLTWAFLGSIL